MSAPLISVAIPNFNYARYLGATIQSILNQKDPNVEIVVSDNASTDASMDVVRSFADSRIRLRVNPTNFGFAANIDRAVELCRGEYIIVLSSDDLMLDGALSLYRDCLSVPGRAQRAVLSSQMIVVNESGAEVSRLGWRPALPFTASERAQLPSGEEVSFVEPGELLRVALRTARNPLYFASTMYSRRLWEEVGGYTAARSINPDKWFHWRILAKADSLAMIDQPCFAYRVHGENQNSQMRRSGALKYLTDQYAYTWDTPDYVLGASNLERDDLNEAFVRHDGLARAGLLLAEGNRREARRYLRFAHAAFPERCQRDWRWWALRSLSSAGPFGSRIAQTALARLNQSEELEGS